MVVLIPKGGKDPKECDLYHPILLMNVDTKILAKSWPVHCKQLFQNSLIETRALLFSRFLINPGVWGLFQVLH